MQHRIINEASMKIRRSVLLHTTFAAASLALLGPATALAQAAFPSKPIRIVVPFPAGQGVDVLARALARDLEAVAGQPVIVDNRPGGNNVIGARAVTSAPADGYTLFFGSNSPMAANAVFFKELGYDAVKDFAPVAQLGKLPWVLVTGDASTHKSFQELADFARGNPSGVSFAVGATGYQLAAILLTQKANLPANIVPYKGSPQAIQDTVGQQVTVTMADIGTLQPLIDGGRLRPLLVLDDKPAKRLPGVPTFKDVKLDVPLLYSWNGIFAPAATPAPVVAMLSSLIERAMRRETYLAAMAKLGSEPAYAGPAALGAFQRAEIESYGQAMKTGRVEPQ